MMIVATTAVAGALALGQSGPAPEPSPHPMCAPSPSVSNTRAAVEVASLDDAQRALVLDVALDVWSESTLADPLVVVLDDEGRAALHRADIGMQTVVPDIDAAAAAERARLQSAQAQRPGDFFSEYRRFEAVDAYLDRLDAQKPELTRIEPLGTSIEGRPIRALRISTAAADAPAYVINGGQHAREWISVATTTCIADRLVRGYGSDPEITALLDEMQVYVVPVVNPDGYEYTWTDDRYWRKNRHEEHGVDLNRNFPVAFGRKGSSDQPASPIYRGTHPFSEPESQALRDLLRRVPVELHIDYHSFSQLVLHPWSHTSEPAADRGRLAALADAMASAIYATHGKRYKVIDGARLYPASGTLMDWVYGEREAASFVVELRPARGDGFILPPEQIVPTCEESLAATLALARRR